MVDEWHGYDVLVRVWLTPCVCVSSVHLSIAVSASCTSDGRDPDCVQKYVCMYVVNIYKQLSMVTQPYPQGH